MGTVVGGGPPKTPPPCGATGARREDQTEVCVTEAAANAVAANSIYTLQVVSVASAAVQLLQTSSLSANPRLTLPRVRISIPKTANKSLGRIIAFPDCSRV